MERAAPYYFSSKTNTPGSGSRVPASVRKVVADLPRLTQRQLRGLAAAVTEEANRRLAVAS